MRGDPSRSSYETDSPNRFRPDTLMSSTLLEFPVIYYMFMESKIISRTKINCEMSRYLGLPYAVVHHGVPYGTQVFVMPINLVIR